MKWFKQFFKKPLYGIMNYLIHSDFFRELFWDSFNDMIRPPSPLPMKYLDSPYASGTDVTKKRFMENTGLSPIFLSARFRSGSTFLWQLFRDLNGVRAYYEPLNENQWFLQQEYKTDPTHIGVTDYAREYQGLSHLSEFYDERWTFRKLHMTAADHDPKLYQYINRLIQDSGKRAVLQFNRIDFRLQWIKANFPRAIIVHLYRHPREQWMSIQKDGGWVDKTHSYKPGDTLDLFYLITWAKDLRCIFPFLEPQGQHPYALHYFLWRLSYIYGTQFANHSIAYEQLVKEFSTIFPRLLEKLNINVTKEKLERLERLNTGEIKETWKDYAEADWFARIETECDRTMKVFFQDRA